MELDCLEDMVEDIAMNDLEEETDLNFQKINQEYDDYIKDLHKRLQITRQNRKKAETDSDIIRNRISLLKTQEKEAHQHLERSKLQINQILQNRKYFEGAENRNKSWRENTKKEDDNLKERVQKLKQSRSSLKSGDSKNLPMSKTPDKKIPIKNPEVTNKKIENLKQANYQKYLLDKKSMLKNEIKKKIELGEFERKSLESLIAQIEKEEMEIYQFIKMDNKISDL